MTTVAFHPRLSTGCREISGQPPFRRAMSLAVSGGVYHRTGEVEGEVLAELGLRPGHFIVDFGCGSFAYSAGAPPGNRSLRAAGRVRRRSAFARSNLRELKNIILRIYVFGRTKPINVGKTKVKPAAPSAIHAGTVKQSGSLFARKAKEEDLKARSGSRSRRSKD